MEDKKDWNYYRYLFARIRLLSMLLLGDNAKHTSQAARIDLRHALYKAMLSNCGAVVLRGEDRSPDDYYIVFLNNQRFTTRNLPAEVPMENVIEVSEYCQKTHIELVDHLKKLTTELSLNLPEYYERFELDEVLALIERDSKEFYSETLFAALLSDLLGDNTRLLEDEDNASHLWTQIVQRVKTYFYMLKIPGDIAGRLFSVVLLYALHPTPSALFQAAKKSVGRLTGYLGSHENVTVMPPLDIGFYIAHLSSLHRANLITAKGVGRITRREGKNSIRRAKQSTGIIQFYENLFRALLTFQAGLVTYDAIRHLGLNVPGVWDEIKMSDEEVQQCWVECEEMRVAILVSISKSAVPSFDGPDLTNPDVFFNFWKAQLENTSADNVQKLIYDGSVQLLYPDVLRDLALLWLEEKTSRDTPKSQRKLQRIIDLLEEGIGRNALLAEPNYLFEAYRILERSLRKEGKHSEAEAVAEKANPDYFNRLVEIKLQALKEESA